MGGACGEELVACRGVGDGWTFLGALVDGGGTAFLWEL